MTNVLFQGTGGMSAVTSSATANFGAESYMQDQLNLIGSVGANPSPDLMMKLANAYKFFSAMWTKGSFTANGMNVDFKQIKGLDISSKLTAMQTKLETLFKSYDHICIYNPDDGQQDLQLKEADGKTNLTLYDLVTGQNGPAKVHFYTSGNQQEVNPGDKNPGSAWFDPNLNGDDDSMDDETHHNRTPGCSSYDGKLDPDRMPPGFNCDFHTYSSDGCSPGNHTEFNLTIDFNKTAGSANAHNGVTAGESGLQWLQQHAVVTPSDANGANQALKDFDQAFENLTNG